MKTFRIVLAVLLVLLALGLSTVTVTASGQTGDSPDTAGYIDNQIHSIQPHTGMWFKFDYDAGNRDIATLTLVDANKSGLRFEVWTPQDVTNTAENKPIGRGTAGKVNCDTGDPTNQGGCETSDLTWVGAFGLSGTYYVQIVNDNDSVKNTVLTIKGASVSLGAPVQPNTGTQVAPPTNVSPPSNAQSVDNPSSAVAIDSAAHTLPAHSATWYSFDYTLPATQGDRLAKIVKLVGGKDSGVRVEVWTPDHVNDWWDNQKPVGQGTVYSVQCDTGQCESNDLTWIGSFNMGGTYYVRVVNDNDHPTNFTLTIQEQLIH